MTFRKAWVVPLLAGTLVNLIHKNQASKDKCDLVGAQLALCTINSKKPQESGCKEIAIAHGLFCPSRGDVEEIKACIEQEKPTCKGVALSQMGLDNSVHAVTLKIVSQIKELEKLARSGEEAPELKKHILSLLGYLKGLDLKHMVSFAEAQRRIEDVAQEVEEKVALYTGKVKKLPLFEEYQGDNKAKRYTENGTELVINNIDGLEGGLGEDSHGLNSGFCEVGGSQGESDNKAHTPNVSFEDKGVELYVRHGLRQLEIELEKLLLEPINPATSDNRSHLGSLILQSNLRSVLIG
ncbi:MAG: hypothetical protein ISQ13_01870 [Candidatus Margulisbacteria bacterium]|nr:hypothetical protein [Candidatus Margulisiibacteriota bacterium]